MKEIEIILSLSGTALGLLVTTLTFLVKFISNVKAKKACEQLIEIGNAVVPFIEQAETFVNYSGKERKNLL